MTSPRIVHLLFAVSVAALGLACDRQGGPQLSVPVVEIHTQRDLPVSVRRQLYFGRDADAGIADPGEPFNRSDAIENPLWPSSRLVVAARRGNSWVVAMERGGFAYGVEVLWFETAEAPPKRLTTLNQPPKSYRELLAWLPL